MLNELWKKWKRKQENGKIGKYESDVNLMKKINCRVIVVPGCVMNVCNLRKGDF